MGVRPPVTRSADSLVGEVRGTITRLSPEEAHTAWQQGALLVDVRSPDEQREQGVVIPGVVHHPLSVVLWRLDELPRETHVILVCRHGYSSSFAAAQLRQLGFEHPADVVGGIEGWQAAGLPLVPL
jgi:rhodanese-related sulfurtransferase